MPQATLLFASLFGLTYVWLSYNVTVYRRKYKVAFGSKEEHPELTRAMRAHGNFQEYVPFFLILLYLAESTTHMHIACYILGGWFFLGRMAHIYSMLVHEPKGTTAGWRLRHTYRYRFVAMISTFATFSLISLWLLLRYVQFLLA